MTSPVPGVTAPTGIPTPGPASAPTSAQAARPMDGAEARTPALVVLGWMGFVLLVVYAIFVGGGWPGIHLTQLRILSLIAAAIILAGWFVVSLRVPRLRPSPPSGRRSSSRRSSWP